MSTRSRLGVEAAVEVRPRAEVEADAVRAFVKGLNGSDRDAGIAHQGVAEGLLKSVDVYGMDAAGNASEHMQFVPADDGKLMVETREGRCALSAVDGSLPRLVEAARRSFERKGLRTYAQYWLRDEIYRDPQRADAVRARLGIVPTTVPSWGPGREPKTAVELRSGHTGSLVRMSKSAKQR